MIETAPLREISIVSYLAYKGIEPANYRAGNFWYRSPLREGDKTPSFVVHEGKNRWHDFATGEGGSIIDLVLQMQPQSSFKEVLEHLQAFAGIAHSFKPAIDHSQAAPAETTGSTSFILDKLVPVNELYRLTNYLASRNITQTAHFHRKRRPPDTMEAVFFIARHSRPLKSGTYALSSRAARFANAVTLLIYSDLASV